MARTLERLDFDRKIEGLERAKKDMARQRDWDTIVEKLFQAITGTLGFDYLDLCFIEDAAKTEVCKSRRAVRKRQRGVLEDCLLGSPRNQRPRGCR